MTPVEAFHYEAALESMDLKLSFPDWLKKMVTVRENAILQLDTDSGLVRVKPGQWVVKDSSGNLEAEFINADVRKEDDVRALVDKTVAQFGRLDVAVNNAGTEGQVGPITDQTAESYAATFDTNVLGVILSMKHEVRVMQGQGSGSIVNISSTYGHEGAAGASVYVGSKHAVEGITKSVALETVKSGIRVNSVAPGPIDTGMLTRFTRFVECPGERGSLQ